MPQRATTLQIDSARISERAALERAFEVIRTELDVREQFPPAALAEAEAEARAGEPRVSLRDETAVPFVTIDPPGSMDLDQAVHIERRGQGFRVRYAIADVPAFVTPGGALDGEARLRGQTIYCPDVRVPLHPIEISEGAASLLPGVVRPAYVWDMALDADGRRRSADLYRALVRSRHRYTYVEVQHLVGAGTAEETLLLLRDVGRLRIRRESQRGGASLPMPEQEVHLDGRGHYRLRLRPLLESEDWNAQISLLTGMVAAGIMLEGRIGVLRTMPAAEQPDVARFRRQVEALGVEWPAELAYGDLLRTLDRHDPRHLAIIHDATSLFRGAAYSAFDGVVPDQPEQAALAAPYTHVTAPLRRLVDRFTLVTCAALANGQDVPSWAREALPLLPDLMARSDRLARAVDRACTDAVEAAVLQHRVGERFDAVVVDRARNGDRTVQLLDPAVTALADGEVELGSAVQVELTTADPIAHTVRFRILGSLPGR